MSKENDKSGDEGIEILEVRFLKGPNVHALFPVMEAKLDLGPWKERASDTELANKLVALLPELETHKCSYDEPGGLLKRLNEGTYPAHIIEHCILSVQNTFGSEVNFGKARIIEDSIYRIVTDYDIEEVAYSALRFSVNLINSLFEEKKSWEETREQEREALEDMKRSALLEERLGPSTSAIIEAAKKRKIPYRKVLSKYSLVYLGWGAKKKSIWGPVTTLTSSIGSDIVQDKMLCKEVLQDQGLPAPKGYVVKNEDDAVLFANRLGYPVVLKPKRGNHGKGVIVDIRNDDEVREAFAITSRVSRDMIVEEFIHGFDYRFLVIDHRVKAVARRIPAHVKGDGISTISELVEKENKDPRRANGHINSLTRIEINDEMISFLDRDGYSLDHVPEEGDIVYLRGNANLSTGGIAEDHTDKVHPSYKVQVERASRILDLDLVGIDVISDDISVPEEQIGWTIIEANASPGLRMHISPNIGEPRPVGDHIVEHLFPDDNGRIPVIAVTGTNGKTTTSRLIDWIIRSDGHITGLAVTGGIYVGGEKVVDGDTSGPWSAQTVLQDPAVEYAVLETARGGIIKRGLGFDRCSVSVVTNIREDHIGIDDIEDIEDIFWVKSVLVEATEETGHCIINANDEFAERLIERAKGKPVLFGCEPNRLTDEFIDKGETVFLREENTLVMYEEGKKRALASMDEVEFLTGGIRMLVENALAAAAAAYSSGISLDCISEALRTFENTERTNPGRLNLYDIQDRSILIDYAHNPDALRALGEYVSAVGNGHNTIVFAGVGDRRDQDLINCGAEISDHFHEIIITEYPEQNRGREDGSISRIIRDGVISRGVEPVLIDDMHEAVMHAVRESKKGDLIALVDLDYTYEQVSKIAEYT